MSTNATPPAWAEAALRLVVKRADFEAVSGDLLEEYRDRIYPARGPEQADVWYVRQVTGYGIRSVVVFADPCSPASDRIGNGRPGRQHATR